MRKATNFMSQTVYGILIPFLGTALGAACVFFMRRQLSDILQRILTGFAAGVMVAASVWSLLIPAMEQAAWMGKLSFVPAFVGFWIGILFLLGLDHLIPHLHAKKQPGRGAEKSAQKNDHDGAGCDASQHPGGNGRRRDKKRGRIFRRRRLCRDMGIRTPRPACHA